MEIIGIIISIILMIVSFFCGAVWLQVKETKFAKESNYNCERCKALGCQSIYCKQMRERN